MTLNVNLTPELEAMVRDKVATGLYSSASEVVREALRLMEEKDRFNKMKLDQLRADIQAGIASGDAGQAARIHPNSSLQNPVKRV